MSNWFPENVSTYGADVDAMFYLIYYITAVWFVLTEGLILYFLFRYRRRPGQRAAYRLAGGGGWNTTCGRS